MSVPLFGQRPLALGCEEQYDGRFLLVVVKTIFKNVPCFGEGVVSSRVEP